MAKEEPAKVIAEANQIARLELPQRHHITPGDLNTRYLHKVLLKTYEQGPQTFEAVLGISGVGPKTIRALSLMAELIYGQGPSFRDPARFSFAHGGKDGHPFPVDRETYDRTIDYLKKGLWAAKIGQMEKLNAMKRLNNFYASSQG